MLFINYFQIFAGIILTAIFGRIIVKNNFASSLFSGLLVLSAIISVTSRYVPLYNLLIIKSLLLVGFLFFCYDLRKNYQYFWTFWQKDKIVPIFIIAAFVALYFFSFHYQFFSFETHSILYFSPSFEILKADYEGNLRVSIHYPSGLSSFHLIPSAFLAVIGFLNNLPNLVYFIEIRYILIVIFFTNFIYSIYKTVLPNPWKLLFILIAIFAIYGEELNYDLSISSFVYVFALLEIFLTILRIKSAPNNLSYQRYLLFLAIILIICKAPIFYVAGGFAFYLWLLNKDSKFHPLIIIAGILVLANMYSWWDMLHISTQAIQDDSRLTLRGFGFKGMIDWSPKDSIRALIDMGNYDKKITAFLVLFYLLIKYYAVFFTLIFKSKKWQDLHYTDRALAIYAALSLIGVIVVRNNISGIQHQAHAYFLMAILCGALLIFKLAQFKFSKNHILFLSVVFVIFALPSKYYGLFSFSKKAASNSSFLKYQDAKLQDPHQEFYTVAKDEPYWKAELQAQMSGLRIKGSDIKYFDSGAIRYWVIGAEDKVIYCEYLLSQECTSDYMKIESYRQKCEYCAAKSQMR